ncbi:unnamed protein product, partial [Prorocentrum cordatum]
VHCGAGASFDAERRHDQGVQWPPAGDPDFHAPGPGTAPLAAAAAAGALPVPATSSRAIPGGIHIVDPSTVPGLTDSPVAVHGPPAGLGTPAGPAPPSSTRAALAAAMGSPASKSISDLLSDAEEQNAAERERERRRRQAQMLANQIEEQRLHREAERERRAREDAEEEQRVARERRELELRYERERAALAPKAARADRPPGAAAHEATLAAPSGTRRRRGGGSKATTRGFQSTVEKQQRPVGLPAAGPARVRAPPAPPQDTEHVARGRGRAEEDVARPGRRQFQPSPADAGGARHARHELAHEVAVGESAA